MSSITITQLPEGADINGEVLPREVANALIGLDISLTTPQEIHMIGFGGESRYVLEARIGGYFISVQKFLEHLTYHTDTSGGKPDMYNVRMDVQRWLTSHGRDNPMGKGVIFIHKDYCTYNP